MAKPTLYVPRTMRELYLDKGVENKYNIVLPPQGQEVLVKTDSKMEMSIECRVKALQRKRQTTDQGKSPIQHQQEEKRVNLERRGKDTVKMTEWTALT